jgi:hypothetical protein
MSHRRRSVRSSAIAALCGLGAILLTACPMLASDPTLTLSAEPTSVASGSASMLTWSSTDATSCQAAGAWTGSKSPSGSESTGALTATSTFTLTCAGDGGSTTQSVTVNVSGAPSPTPSPAPTLSFSVSPASVTAGGASTLTWSSSNATACQASGAWSGARPTSGSQSTGALTATTTYTLACTGSGGSTSQSVTVNVTTSPAPPPITPATAALSWTPSTDADVLGYRVYYGTASRAYDQPRGSGLDAQGATRFVVQNLTRGQRYYFAVTSYDAAGNESVFSAEVSKLIQ